MQRSQIGIISSDTRRCHTYPEFAEWTFSFCSCEGICVFLHVLSHNAHTHTQTHINAHSTYTIMQTNRHEVENITFSLPEDSEDIHFQRFLCFSFSTQSFVRSLVCLSHSLGCRTAPLVFLLTCTHNICLSFCIQPSGGSLCRTKLCQDLYLPYIQLWTPHFHKPFFLAQSFALWLSVFKHKITNKCIKGSWETTHFWEVTMQIYILKHKSHTRK